MTILQIPPRWAALVWVVVLPLLVANRALAQSAKFHDRYTLQGFSQPLRVSAVASATPGIVESRGFREGDWVRRGECLLKLDSSVHDARLELARVTKDSLGDLETAKAELAADQTRLQRIRNLVERQHATQNELLQAEEIVAVSLANLRRSQDSLAQQEADFARLQAESKQYSVLAPFEGVIVEFTKREGEYVGPGEFAVCTLADLSTLLVEFLVPGHYRHNFQIDDQVEVFFTVAGRDVPGTVQYISPFPNGETNTYTVKVRVDNADGTLNAGERCRLDGHNRARAHSRPTAREQFTKIH